MPADPVSSASDVVLQRDKAIAAQTKSGMKPPFNPIGLLQIFGNGLEVAYDSVSSHNPQGEEAESYIGGVGDIAKTDQNRLLIVTFISGKQKVEAGAMFLSVAQSIYLAGH